MAMQFIYFDKINVKKNLKQNSLLTQPTNYLQKDKYLF